MNRKMINRGKKKVKSLTEYIENIKGNTIEQFPWGFLPVCMFVYIKKILKIYVLPWMFFL